MNIDMHTLVGVAPLGSDPIGDIIHGNPVDAALAKLVPSLPGDSPAVVLVRETAAKFRAMRLTDEVAVATSLLLTVALAAELVAAGVPRGKVVNSLPAELRSRLQTGLPFAGL